MKKKFLIIIITFVLSIFIASCQEYDMPHSEIKVENRFKIDEFAPYKEGELVIKLKENKSSLETLFSSSNQEIKSESMLLEAGITSFDVINTKSEQSGFLNLNSKATDTWIHATYDQSMNMEEVMLNLSQLESVVAVEPNYEFSLTLSTEFKQAELPKLFENSINLLGDPLRSSQYYLDVVKIKETRDFLIENGINPGGSRDVVVAVIDTGVDYNHEDLKNNMWINPGEIPNDGIDNDGNGIIDDIHGANFVSDKRFHNGNPYDDNGHGTAIAGIIAAEANNGLGIEGIAHNVQIMAVKVGGHGTLYATDIAEGIYYAYEMGADVINMSVGAYVNMILIEDALSLAFSTAVLVGAAANDSTINLPHPMGASFYPAAYPFVIGAMASNGYSFASYSNFDFQPYDAHEYALVAPGTGLMSTLPGNRYGSASGTSLSAPVISGIAALVRSYFDPVDYKSRFIMGQLEGTADPIIPLTNLQYQLGVKWSVWNQVNALNAVTTFPEPFVHNYDFIIFDDVAIDPENNNGDGIIDHGETIHVALLMRNHWGRAKDLKVTIDNINGALFNDPFSEVLVSTQNYGDVSSFSTVDNGLIYNEEGVLVGVENPFVIKIKDNAPNDYGIHFRVFYETKNGLDETDETVYTQGNRRLSFFMIIRNGIELPSIINEDMTLTNENYYIIPNAVRIAEGVTVKVEEGTNIQFWSAKPESPYAEKPIAQLQVDGKLIIEGSPDHPVEIFPSEIYWAHEVKIFPRNNGEIYMNYVNIVNPRVTATHIKHAYFRNNLAMLLRRVFRDGDVYDEQTEPHVYAQTIDNSIFWRLTGYYDMRTNYHPYRLDIKGFVTNSLFDSNHLRLNFQGENNVFLGNFFRDMGYYDDYQLATSGFNMNKTGVGSFEVEKVFNNNFDSVYAIIQWSENSIDRFLDMTGATLATIDSEEENEFIRKHIESTQLNNILFGLAYNQALNQFVDYEGVVSTYLNLGEPIDAYQHNFSSNPLLRIGLDGKFYPSHEINNNLKHYLIEFNDFFEYEALVSLMDLNGEDITVLGFDDQTYPINDILENTSFTYDQVDIIFETPNVIEVKNDQLEILNEGITKVTIVSKDRSYIKSFVIKVISSLTDDLVLADSALIETSDFMLIGKTYRFDFDLSPVNSNETVYLVSSDEAILKIVQAPNNMIIPLSKGVVKVMLMSESGKVLGEKTIDVDYDVTSIRLNKDIYYVSLNSQEVLSYTLSHDALFNDVQWISSDETIAYVDDSNQLIILKEGTIKIAVKHLTSGQMDEAIVTVNNDFTENDVFIDIQATSREMFALTSQGTVWRWGGGIDSRTATVLPLENILFMSTSYNAALFVDKDGNAFYYNGNIESITSIKNVISASLFDVGGGHMSLIREDGSIWAKGDNSYNQLGNNSSTRYDDFIEIIGIDNPVKTISTRWTNYFLNEAGNLYYLGFPTNTTTPIKVGIDEKIVDIKHYQNQNCWEGAVIIAEDINGDFYKVQANSWSKVESQLDIKQYINVGSCGGASDFILTDDGDVYAKGPNFDGNLGLGSSTYVGDYQKVEIDNITKISASQTNTMAINDLGQIFVWGNNDFYQVGDMTYVDSLVPFMVPIGLILDERPVEIESVTFEKNNDLMLTNSSIIIDFNKSVQISQNYFNIRLMDENNVYVSLNRTLLLDKIVLTPTRPLNPSKTYKLDIPENAVIDLFTQANIAKQMDITTHSVLDIYSESFEIDSTLYAYLNKYVDHYLNLMFDIYQIDGYFSTFTNNAILNHLHSTDMDGWLRFYGEESDDIIPLTRNYYGTTSSFIANLHAIDFNNFQILSDFVIDPILSKPNESMYPFVYDVKYFDESNQETTVLSTGLMTFKLYFNRDMDTTIQPLVFFGPEYPYTDYVVSGDWVDERTWVGQYNITPLTGDGLNYMRIRDAYAKDNAWLRTGDDDGRFTFDIATFGVESINLSSESLDGGVKLNWSQDEYETMMGYNIYRSEKVDGIFERVNFTVIPYTDNTFIDRTVEPGKVYFYKYSIVKTDLSEANFSDIIPGASIDTILPSVSHNRIYEVELGQNVIISLNATDNIQVIGATLFYKNANDATFKSLDMLKGTNDRYFQTIRASEIDVLGLEYYFEVYDGVNTYSYGSASASNFVVVKESITNPITSGDINNDGILNILDVLMMLQAINNIITLDSEAFERADLNQDDILSAFEALALLQFITGTRNTLVD